MHIRKNDKVLVISGKEKGKQGRVLKVLPDSRKAIVERVNMIKRHERASQRNQQGGIVEKEASLPLAKLMLICPKCGAATRTGHKKMEDKSKVRVCKKCNETLA